MEPVSGTFLLLVCGLTAVCVTATVVGWPRLAGSGARPLLARSGMLLATQALLTAAAILLTNRYFVFYATWNDLFGSDTTNAQVEQVQPTGGAHVGATGFVHRTSTDLGPLSAAVPSRPAPAILPLRQS